MNVRRKRTGRRIKLNQTVMLSNSDGLSFEVLFTDLSACGFRIAHHGEDLIVGETVTVTSARGATARGQIKWTKGNEAGGVFLDQPEALD